MDDKEFSVTTSLPNNGQRVLAFGFRTFCCQQDKEDERNWHEVIFSFEVSSYKLKSVIPEDIEESILELCECYENWDIYNDEDPKEHLIGVTKWKNIE